MKEYTYKRVRFAQAKLVISALCLIAFVVLMIEGINLITMVNERGKIIENGEFEEVFQGSNISGSLNEILARYDMGEDLSGEMRIKGYVVRTGKNNMILFEALEDSPIDQELKALYEGDATIVRYTGYVVALKDDVRKPIVDKIEEGQIKRQEVVTGDLLYVAVQASQYGVNMNGKAIMGAFVGAGIMLLLCYFIGRKAMRNVIFQLSLKFRKVALKPEVRREDLALDDVYADFTGHQDPMVHLPVPEEPGQEDGLPPVGKMRYSDAEYYESNLNKDGNFYVETDPDKKPDDQDKMVY